MEALSLLLVIVAIATFFALFYNAKRISDVDRKATSGYATAAPAPTDSGILTDKDGNKVPRKASFVKVKKWTCAKSAATPPVYTQTVTVLAGVNTATFLLGLTVWKEEFGQVYIYNPPTNKAFKVEGISAANASGEIDITLVVDASAVTVTADTAAAPACSAGGVFGSTPLPSTPKAFTLVAVPAEVSSIY